jgi:hypothetical protein
MPNIINLCEKKSLGQTRFGPDAQTDGCTDGQSDYYRPRASATKWRGPNEYHLFKTEITLED